jgi:hypothetical protein
MGPKNRPRFGQVPDELWGYGKGHSSWGGQSQNNNAGSGTKGQKSPQTPVDSTKNTSTHIGRRKEMTDTTTPSKKESIDLSLSPQEEKKLSTMDIPDWAKQSPGLLKILAISEEIKEPLPSTARFAQRPKSMEKKD